MTATEIVLFAAFWVCLGGVAYTYVGYPCLIFAFSRLFGRRPTPPSSDANLPKVTVLIAAFNEEEFMQARLENALASDYPPHRLEVVVATDGCSDRTVEIARGFADRGVRVLSYPVRRGKASVLNATIPHLSGDVVVLSDANTFMDPKAVRRLVRWFADPQVGSVCGRLILTDPETGSNADGLYWKYETFLKRCEGRLGALLGANGGIYAVRRDVYAEIPPDTIIDDFVIPLEAKLRSGCAIVYDSSAEAWEETPARLRAEFGRRARIGAGGFQSLQLLWRLLSPAQGWVSFTLLSHKVMRWVCPFLLIGLLVSNLLLWAQPGYLGFLAAQALFYLLAAAMAFVPPKVRVLKPLRLTTMFAGMNLALLLGFWRWLSGRQSGAWSRTARVAPAPTILTGSHP